MESEIQSFYKNQAVFLTGGTGFFGRVVIEKLLRSTEVKCVYVLIREKRRTAPKERLNALASDILFERLLQEKPNALQLLKPVVGDCSLPNLGLSESDRNELIENVNIVLHLAATVRFDESIERASRINIRATVDLIQIVREMRKLKAFVHTSSAFANCMQKPIEEVYYVTDIGTTSEEMLKELNELKPDEFNEKFKQPCSRYPNTYTFTKSLAEEAIMRYAKALPCCIFRPGIIISTSSEPVPGWIDNLLGPTALTHGWMHGVVRVVPGDLENTVGLVPVDFCANQLLACAWYITTMNARDGNLGCDGLPPIFNLVPKENNQITWSFALKIMYESLSKDPPCYSLWFPFVILTQSMILFEVLHFLLHVIPGLLIDFALIITGKQPKMTKLYKKMLENIELVSYFPKRQFSFSITNTERMWESLSENDKKLFCFNIMDINWTIYMRNITNGIRLYLCKAKPKDIQKDLKKFKILRIIHYAFLLFLSASAIVVLHWIPVALWRLL